MAPAWLCVKLPAFCIPSTAHPRHGPLRAPTSAFPERSTSPPGCSTWMQSSSPCSRPERLRRLCLPRTGRARDQQHVFVSLLGARQSALMLRAEFLAGQVVVDEGRHVIVVNCLVLHHLAVLHHQDPVH